MIRLHVPIRLASLTNQREHWTARHRRVKQQRQWVRAAWLAAGVDPRRVGLPCTVRITRIGPRRMDGDNCQAAAKHVRDEIAAILGVDDGDGRVSWVYDQGKGDYGLLIEVEGA